MHFFFIYLICLYIDFEKRRQQQAKISVIIPTFNRFHYIFQAIASVIKQTYKNLEIIIINDKSTDPLYYIFPWEILDPRLKIIHLETSSVEKKKGIPSAGYVRNQGIEIATGDLVAFLDDDDYWFPEKLEKQVQAMKETGCKLSCTDGFIGTGLYKKQEKYLKYNSGFYWERLQEIYNSNNVFDFFDKEKKQMKKIWTQEHVMIHNCVITSSVLIDRQLLLDLGKFEETWNGHEDYNLWKNAIKKTNFVYLNDLLFYYDVHYGESRIKR